LTDVILDQFPDGVVLIDLEGVILGWMGNAKEIFGYSPHETEGKNLELLFHNANDGNILQQMMEAVEKRSFFEGEIFCSRKDGSTIVSELCAKIIADSSGNPVGIVCSFRDYSARKRLKKEQITVDKQQTLSQFSGAIAHELNNVLTAIMGSLSLTKLYAAGNDNLDSIIDDIEDASKEAAKISRKLLAYSKGGTPNGSEVLVSQLIQNATKLYLKDQSTTLDYSIQNELEFLKLDEGLFSHVFNVLIENSCQTMQNGGKLQISIAETSILFKSELPLAQGNYIKISLKDTGFGIAHEHLKNVFDPLFTTKEKPNGLSLATVYATVRNLGGIITVDSELSRGKTFTIYIPKMTPITSLGG